jgi:hypothetical protein
LLGRSGVGTLAMYPKFKDIFTVGGADQCFYGVQTRFIESDARIFHKELFMNFVKVYAREAGDEKVIATHIRVSEDYGTDDQYYLDWLMNSKKILGIPLRHLPEVAIT